MIAETHPAFKKIFSINGMICKNRRKKITLQMFALLRCAKYWHMFTYCVESWDVKMPQLNRD